MEPVKHDYTTVPNGTYKCRVAEVICGATRGGDERWSLRLVVIEGPHKGQQAAWDSIVFSARGRARARMVIKALGCKLEDPTPRDLEGLKAFVEVRKVVYRSPYVEDSEIARNEVPYDGYKPV